MSCLPSDVLKGRKRESLRFSRFPLPMNPQILYAVQVEHSQHDTKWNVLRIVKISSCSDLAGILHELDARIYTELKDEEFILHLIEKLRNPRFDWFEGNKKKLFNARTNVILYRVCIFFTYAGEFPLQHMMS